MKKFKSLITTIGILILFNFSLLATSIPEEEPIKVEKWMTESLYNNPEKEYIYVDNLFEFNLVSKIISRAQKLFPSEFKGVEIIIELGEESFDQPLEAEQWMFEPFLIEEEVELEDWMTKPFIK